MVEEMWMVRHVLKGGFVRRMWGNEDAAVRKGTESKGDGMGGLGVNLSGEGKETGTEGRLKMWTCLKRRILTRPQMIVMVNLSRRLVAE